MPFRARFDCLWCGRTWQARSSGDLEGWAVLCPDCLGLADDNAFLRGRLRTALRERTAAAASASARAGSWEDWYLRREPYARGPVHDGAWSMELDEVTRWVDGLRLAGVIVELGAGMGWWSALLAEKGELWLYDDDGASLDAARTRLLAHGLLAHLHQRELLARPDKQVDVVFAAYLLGTAASAQACDDRLAAVLAWLKPGGSYVLVEARTAADAETVDGPAGPLRTWDVEALGGRLVAAGFEPVEVGETQGGFVYGEAMAPAP